MVLVSVWVNDNSPALKSTGHQNWGTFHNPINSQWIQSSALLNILFHSESHHKSKMGCKEQLTLTWFIDVCRNVRICHNSPVPSLWASSASPRWWSYAPTASSRSPLWFQTMDLVWRYTPSAACRSNTWRCSLKTQESTQKANKQHALYRSCSDLARLREEWFL